MKKSSRFWKLNAYNEYISFILNSFLGLFYKEIVQCLISHAWWKRRKFEMVHTKIGCRSYAATLLGLPGPAVWFLSINSFKLFDDSISLAFYITRSYITSSALKKQPMPYIFLHSSHLWYIDRVSSIQLR